MAVEEQADAGIPEWVVTFGDMMSLLLTFFIMLVSMSEIKEEERFQAMVESMRHQFGHEATMSSLVPGDHLPRNSNMSYVASEGRARRKDTLQGGDKVQAPVGDFKRVASPRAGQNATAGGVIEFDETSFKLSDANKEQLKEIAEQIAGKPQRIEVRGHTTPQPAPKQDGLRDNWDLAYERGRSVADFLVQQGVRRDRIRIGVAGRNEPLYTGVDPLELKRNARVKILMWDETVEPVDAVDEH